MDFGLGDDIIIEKRLLSALRWHGFLYKTVTWTGYPSNSGLNCIVKDGMGDDSGEIPLNPVTKVTK